MNDMEELAETLTKEYDIKFKVEYPKLQANIKEAHPKLSLNTINNYIKNWKRVESHLKTEFP